MMTLGYGLGGTRDCKALAVVCAETRTMQVHWRTLIRAAPVPWWLEARRAELGSTTPIHASPLHPSPISGSVQGHWLGLQRKLRIYPCGHAPHQSQRHQNLPADTGSGYPRGHGHSWARGGRLRQSHSYRHWHRSRWKQTAHPVLIWRERRQHNKDERKYKGSLGIYGN